MSNVGAFGIDFGSLRSCIAVAKPVGVEIISNEASHHETQNIVGFGQKERFIGEQGFMQFKSNFKNTVHYFTRFLDVKNLQNASMEIDKNEPEKQFATLFDKGCSIPNVKSLTFNRDDAIRFTLYYDPVPPGTDEILG